MKKNICSNKHTIDLFLWALAWFKAVQTMASFAFITNSLMILFLIITATTSYRASVKILTVTAILAGLTSLFALIAVSIFGAETDSYRSLDRLTGLGLDTYSDRGRFFMLFKKFSQKFISILLKGKWMPRPEYTFLSWSYICEVFCGIFSLITSIYIILM